MKRVAIIADDPIYLVDVYIFKAMGKTFSTKTHMSSFVSHNYEKEKMKRYWNMINNISSDSMLDPEELTELIQKLRNILENEVSILMRKWITIPSNEK